MLTNTKLITALLLLSVLIPSCTFEKNPSILPELSDADLYKLATDVNTVKTYYKNGAFLSPNPGSPHGKFKIRFNDKALTVLNSSTLKLPKGSSFPNGSVVLKETYDNNNKLVYNVIMYKSTSDKNSAEGWLWSEYGPTGNVIVGVASKGASCVACHKAGEGLQRDLTRIFEF